MAIGKSGSLSQSLLAGCLAAMFWPHATPAQSNQLPKGFCGQPEQSPDGIKFVIPYYLVQKQDCTYKLTLRAFFTEFGGEGFSRPALIIEIYNPCTGKTTQFQLPEGDDMTVADEEQALQKLCTQKWFDMYFPPRPFSNSREPAAAISSAPSSGQASQNYLGIDLNGDGIPDNVYTSASGIVVELLDDTGAIMSTNQYAAGFSIANPVSSHIVAGDFNNDGKIDLAVSNLGNVGNDPGGLAILLGNGDGTFGPPTSVAAGLNPLAMAAGDFDGDGNLDIAAGNQWSGTLSSGILIYGPGTVSILLGKGDGTFSSPATNPTGEDTQGIPVSLLAVDLNGDGHPDLAVANRNDRSISVLINSGGGKFKPPSVIPMPFDVSYLAYADFNHDQNSDLVAAAGGSNALIVLTGNGDGTFKTPAAYVTSNSPQSIGVIPLGDGTTFLFTVDDITGAPWLTTVSPQGVVGAPPLNVIGGRPTAVAAGDLNGDGQADMVITGGASDVSVLLSQNGQYQSALPYSLGQPSPQPRAAAIGELNHDGTPDLIDASAGAFGQRGSVSVLLGNGQGTFKAATSTPLNQNAQSIALGDFNADGNLDVAIAAYGSTSGGSDQGGLAVLFGKGDGTFQAPVTLEVNGLHPEAVAAADLNGDGILDLAAVLVASPGKQAVLAVFRGSGSGAFQPARTFPLRASGGTQSGIAIGDLNGDGIPDIAVVSNFDQQVDILLGDAAGGFTEAAVLPSLPAAGATGVVMTDVDQDGKLDLALANGSMLLGNGDGTFQAAQQFLSGASPTGVAVTKFNGKVGLISVDQTGTVTAVSLIPASPAATASATNSIRP